MSKYDKTRPETYNDAPYYRVRVTIGGQVVHLASSSEPKVKLDARDHDVEWVAADWIELPEYGDTIGYIDWPKVSAITWRRTLPGR